MTLLEEVCHWGGVGFEASKVHSIILGFFPDSVTKERVFPFTLLLPLNVTSKFTETSRKVQITLSLNVTARVSL